MSENQFYFDDPEGDVLSPLTSHPNFVALESEFYFDCVDDFAPFGNDDGADVLYDLEEWYQINEGKGDLMKWLFKTIDRFGFENASEHCARILDEQEIQNLHDEDPHFIPAMDNAIIATAFGQMKIAGQINPEIKELALIALKRQMLMHKNDDGEFAGERMEKLNIMSSDLMKIA